MQFIRPQSLTHLVMVNKVHHQPREASGQFRPLESLEGISYDSLTVPIELGTNLIRYIQRSVSRPNCDRELL